MCDRELCYKLEREIPIVNGNTSAISNNLSVSFSANANLTCAVVANKNQAHTVSWDDKFEWMVHNIVPAKDLNTGKSNKKVEVMQVKFCSLKSRTTPVLVICTVAGASNFSLIFHRPDMEYSHNYNDVLAVSSRRKNQYFLFYSNKMILQKKLFNCIALWKYTKGVACIEDEIFIGCHAGTIFRLSIKNDTAKLTGSWDEYNKEPVVDMVTFRNWLVVANMKGDLLVFDSELHCLKNIYTGLSINCIISVNNWLACGTIIGQVVLYDIEKEAMLAEINAHSQPITDLDYTAGESLILSTSEDSFVRVWRLENSTTPKISCCFSTSVENVPIVGGCFTDAQGSSFLLSGYDYSVMFYFRLTQ
ncbi:WD repeat-containing protein 54 [Trichinella murrelli]|uniref:WD repeat-containing protein 54 n=1 Tax=Trichinella murrelli TaxID=144512 RepID=A0A0V0TWI0_9BILA|nr:WD repeat-containing protein 54 [Trichinella murrelli]